jgi:hypothetical protein
MDVNQYLDTLEDDITELDLTETIYSDRAGKAPKEYVIASAIELLNDPVYRDMIQDRADYKYYVDMSKDMGIIE